MLDSLFHYFNQFLEFLYWLVLKPLEALIIFFFLALAGFVKISWDAISLLLEDFGIMDSIFNAINGFSPFINYLLQKFNMHNNITLIINAYLTRFFLSLFPFSPFK